MTLVRAKVGLRGSATIVLLVLLAMLLVGGLASVSAQTTQSVEPSANASPLVEPIASAAPVTEGGDIRSDGAGPGLVGSPLVVLGGVVLLGLVTVGITALLVRLTRRS
jgi:hypothetical protein